MWFQLNSRIRSNHTCAWWEYGGTVRRKDRWILWGGQTSSPNKWRFLAFFFKGYSVLHAYRNKTLIYIKPGHVCPSGCFFMNQAPLVPKKKRNMISHFRQHRPPNFVDPLCAETASINKCFIRTWPGCKSTALEWTGASAEFKARRDAEKMEYCSL